MKIYALQSGKKVKNVTITNGLALSEEATSNLNLQASLGVCKMAFEPKPQIKHPMHKPQLKKQALET